MEREGFWQRSYLKPLFLEIRCPDCHTIYRVDSRDVEAYRVPYECWNCGCSFKIVVEGDSLPRIVVYDRKSRFELKPQKSASPNAVAAKVCPKCGALNATKDEVCRKCHYVFAVEYWKKQEKGPISLSLVRFWHEVVEDYHNLKKHLDFLQRCEQLDMLPFALRRYEQLKNLNPEDQIARNLYWQVLAKVTQQERQVNLNRSHLMVRWLELKNWFIKKTGTWNWSLIIFIFGCCISGTLVVLGLRSPNLSNLVGLGLSLLFVQVFMRILRSWRY